MMTKTTLRAIKMAQGVKALTAIRDDLSSAAEPTLHETVV